MRIRSLEEGAAELGHNSGVSPEIAAEAMKRALAPWQDRRAEFEAKSSRAVVDCQDAAAAAVDFVRKARALADKGEQLLTEVQGPYADAAAAAKGVARRFIESVEGSIEKIETALKAYNEERRRKAEDQARQQQDAEGKLRAAAGVGEEERAPAPPQRRGRRKVAPIRTDQGGLLVEHDTWHVEVDDVSQIPAMVLQSPKVLEAIRIVAHDFMKNGVAIAGCRRVDGIRTVIR